MSGRPFSCREEDEEAVAEAAWRRRRWGELSIAAAAGGGLVGLVCYQLYGDPRADSSELAVPELDEPPRGRGLLPIPVAAAKETVSAWSACAHRAGDARGLGCQVSHLPWEGFGGHGDT